VGTCGQRGSGLFGEGIKARALILAALRVAAAEGSICPGAEAVLAFPVIELKIIFSFQTHHFIKNIKI